MQAGKNVVGARRFISHVIGMWIQMAVRLQCQWVGTRYEYQQERRRSPYVAKKVAVSLASFKARRAIILCSSQAAV